MKDSSKSWQRFKKHIAKIPSRVGWLRGALAVAITIWEESIVAGLSFIVRAWLADNKRTKTMEDAAKELAKHKKNGEAGQRQKRPKNTIEQHDRDSVRLGDAHELFLLAKNTGDLRQTVLDIFCAHIRQTTGEGKYKEKHKTKPSEEIQSLLTLLFTQEHGVFEDCSINLQGSYLNGATLSQARLKKANLMKAQLQGADLKQAQLQEADLWLAQLQKANLAKAQLQRANFFNAQLQKANLAKAQLQEAKLWKAQLQEAELKEAQLQGATLWLAQLQKANLSKAQLQRANFFNAQMQKANLAKAQLQGADLGLARLQGANLWEVQLQEADLMDVRLQGATLRHAQLQGANLMDVQLQGAALFEVQLQGATLWQAQLQGVSSHKAYSVFERKIRNRTGKSSDLTGIIFAGELQEEDLDTLSEGLSDDQAQTLRKTLRPHVGQPASHELPPNSGAKTGAYTQKKAEQWIAEYNKAMRKASRADDTADAASTPDSDKSKGD